MVREFEIGKPKAIPRLKNGCQPKLLKTCGCDQLCRVSHLKVWSKNKKNPLMKIIIQRTFLVDIIMGVAKLGLLRDGFFTTHTGT